MPRVQEGLVFNIQRSCIHDGPGTRTTVFLKGCPLRCQWCANPEGIDFEPEVLFNAAACTHCGHCATLCPEQIHWMTATATPAPTHAVNHTRVCTGCGACVQGCPQKALSISGTAMTVEQVMHEVMADAPFYHISGGGITLSGGEAMMQAEFALALLTACKQQGIHRTVETCGLYSAEKLALLTNNTDLILFDIKHINPTQHRQKTGADNTQILSNLKQLLKGTTPITVRIPLKRATMS